MNSIQHSKNNWLARWPEWSVRQIVIHRQTAVALGTIAVAGILLTSLIIVRKNQLNERTWQMLALAENRVWGNQINEGISILSDLTNRTQSGLVLDQAYLLLGNLDMASGSVTAAVNAYEQGLKRVSNENNKPLLLTALAAAYEDTAQLPKAVDAYNQLLKDYPDHYLVPRVLLCLVRIQSKNNLDAARDSYEKLLTLYPDTLWTKRAGTYLQPKTIR